MLIGYARISKNDGSQVTDLQIDALTSAGVQLEHIYKDEASGYKKERIGLANCLKALRKGDVLVVWKLDRIGRSLRYLVNLIEDLTDRGVDLKVLTGHGTHINTTTPSGKMIFGIFAALAEFEKDLIRERTMAGLAEESGLGI